MIGAGMHPVLQAARRNGWCKFVEASPRAFHESLLGLQSSSTPDLPQLATAAPRYWGLGYVGAGCGIG